MDVGSTFVWIRSCVYTYIFLIVDQTPIDELLARIFAEGLEGPVVNPKNLSSLLGFIVSWRIPAHNVLCVHWLAVRAQAERKVVTWSALLVLHAESPLRESRAVHWEATIWKTGQTNRNGHDWFSSCSFWPYDRVVAVVWLIKRWLVVPWFGSVYEPGKRHWIKIKKDYLGQGVMTPLSWVLTMEEEGEVSHDPVQDTHLCFLMTILLYQLVFVTWK